LSTIGFFDSLVSVLLGRQKSDFFITQTDFQTNTKSTYQNRYKKIAAIPGHAVIPTKEESGEAIVRNLLLCRFLLRRNDSVVKKMKRVFE